PRSARPPRPPPGSFPARDGGGRRGPRSRCAPPASRRGARGAAPPGAPSPPRARPRWRDGPRPPAWTSGLGYRASAAGVNRPGLATSFRGSFNLARPDDVAAHRVKDLLKKVPQLDPAEVEDVVMGTGFPEGPQGFNTGRNVALLAGLPVTVPGGTVSRFCSSGLNAVMVAAHMVQVEGYDVIIGGGLESITMLQNDFNKTNLFNPYFKDHHSAIYMPMGQTAEIVADRYKVSREVQDRYALLSQQRTAAAQREGKFKDEIAPMKATMEVTDKATGQKSRKEVVVDRDECNRPDTTLEGLAKLPPAF